MTCNIHLIFFYNFMVMWIIIYPCAALSLSDEVLLSFSSQSRVSPTLAGFACALCKKNEWCLGLHDDSSSKLKLMGKHESVVFEGLLTCSAACMSSMVKTRRFAAE